MNTIKLKLTDTYPYGKWKGVPITQMIPVNDYENFTSFSIFGRGDGLNYLQWVKKECKNIQLSKGIVDRMNQIQGYRSNRKDETKISSHIYNSENKIHYYDHYNDIGNMTGLTFQDLYEGH